MLLVITSIILGLVALFYLFLQSKWTKWQKLGVKVVKPKFPFGSVPFVVTRTVAISEAMAKLAQEHNWTSTLGGYILHKPILIIQDPELAKTIMVKDFASFHDRGNPDMFKNWSKAIHKVDKLSINQMTMAPGETWQNLRSTFTPIS